MAGSAITASPSQLGARTTMRSGSDTLWDWVIIFGLAPAAVHPKPKTGIAAHVHFEDVGAALRELAQRVGAGWPGRIHRVLVDHAKPPAWQRQREHGDHWCAGPQGQRRERRRGRGRASEEVD